MSAWYTTAYRRAVIDMHITDHDERFLTSFDPAAYVDALVTARVQSAVVYAHSHVGLCLYPTRVGEMHSGLRGRDTLREIIERCHAHDIAAVLYVSAIHDRWAYQHHPEWRMVRADGRQAAESSRHGFCCPNSPYRTYLSALATEICQNYALDGIRFDMTFWPVVCYCRHCQARFADEVGGDLPRTIDWSDPHWVAFQHKREDWLVEFATLQMTTVKKIKPQVSVEHQASTYTHTWLLGVDERRADEVRVGAVGELRDEPAEDRDDEDDETTEDGVITLERLECNAACDYAPVMMVNWEFFDNMTPQKADELLDKLLADEEVVSSRGAVITTWKEAERVLAGFPDGRADEGPSAGPASLAGVEIAREKNWKAPAADAKPAAPEQEAAQ